MAFDKSLDNELWSETADFETTKIKVSIMSYNEGPKKVQISRENLVPSTGDYRFSKLGRLTKDESEAVLPMLQKALENF